MRGTKISVNDAIENDKWYKCWYETGYLGYINVNFISFKKLDPAYLAGDYINIVKHLRDKFIFLMTLDLIPLPSAPFNHSYNRWNSNSLLSSYIKLIDKQDEVYIDSLLDNNCKYEMPKGSEIYCIQDTAFTHQFGLLRFDRSVKIFGCTHRTTLAYVLPTNTPSDYYIQIKEKPSPRYQKKTVFGNLLKIVQLIEHSDVIKLKFRFTNFGNVDIRIIINSICKVQLSDALAVLKTDAGFFNLEVCEFVRLKITAMNMSKDELVGDHSFFSVPELLDRLLLVNAESEYYYNRNYSAPCSLTVINAGHFP